MLFLWSLRERMTSIVLNGRAYVQTAELAAASGGNFDALIGRCSLKSQADVVWCCVVFVWGGGCRFDLESEGRGRSFGCVGLVGRVRFPVT